MNKQVVDFFSNNSNVCDRLAKGYSRQLFESIQKTNCNIENIFELLFQLNPNTKSYARISKRLRTFEGVIKSGVSKQKQPLLQILFRTCFVSETFKGSEKVFDEETISYTRLDAQLKHNSILFTAQRVFFSLHAIQRLIQRSNLNFRKPRALEQALNAEGLVCLAALKDDSYFGSETNSYVRSKNFLGAWPTEVTMSHFDAGWPRTPGEDQRKFQTLSVRSFISPDEMTPQVYLLWKNDPRFSFLQSV